MCPNHHSKGDSKRKCLAVFLARPRNPGAVLRFSNRIKTLLDFLIMRVTAYLPSLKTVRPSVFIIPAIQPESAHFNTAPAKRDGTCQWGCRWYSYLGLRPFCEYDSTGDTRLDRHLK